MNNNKILTTACVFPSADACVTSLETVTRFISSRVIRNVLQQIHQVTALFFVSDQQFDTNSCHFSILKITVDNEVCTIYLLSKSGLFSAVEIDTRVANTHSILEKFNRMPWCTKLKTFRALLDRHMNPLLSACIIRRYTFIRASNSKSICKITVEPEQ